jgi:hypothetical protein
LWLKELTSLDLYNDIETDIKTINLDQKVEFELSTELLKKRLQEMDSKSPFNIEYNPGLENLIKSFLKNRKKGFERLMALSEYYFPLFEEALAKQNGLRLENILPPGIDGKPTTAEETLKRLALGELDPTRLAQDVRKLAAVGQPQFVRDLLGQGINLDQIYAPYKRTMANILELDEGQIDLLDPTLRMGINDKGDVNLYDYSKALRQDSRWQYTGKAREEVSDAALTVLRNFGFQG